MRLSCKCIIFFYNFFYIIFVAKQYSSMVLLYVGVEFEVIPQRKNPAHSSNPAPNGQRRHKYQTFYLAYIHIYIVLILRFFDHRRV